MMAQTEALAFLLARTENNSLAALGFEGEALASAWVEASPVASAAVLCAIERLDSQTSAEVFASLSCEELECVKSEVAEVRKVLGRFAKIHLSDQAIENALILALVRFNETPPIATSFSPCQMKRWSQCWRAGALSELFLALAGVEARNFTRPASQTGASKFDDYMKQHAKFEQEFRTLAESIKRQLNITSGFSWGWGWQRGG